MSISASEPKQKWLAIPEVAAWLGVSIPTVRRWIKSGDLVGIHLSQNLVRVDRESVDRLVAESLIQ